MQIARGEGNVFAHRTIDFAAEQSGVAAQVLSAAPARIALSAGNNGIDDHWLAWLEPTPCTCRFDDSRRLVSHDDGVAHAGMIAGVDAQIRMAHCSRSDTHQNV